jgi:hypothetical protein
MPITNTQVSLSSIQTEFGGSNPISMSEYYRGGAYVPSNQPTSLTDGTPISTSGLIRIGMFRGLSAALTLSGPATAYGSVGGLNGQFFTVNTSFIYLTASGGVPPYTYSWTHISGSTAVVSNPTSNSTQFSRGQTVPSSLSGVYRCTVTDSNSATATKDVVVDTQAYNNL